ncbi:uncharacterized protein SCHCODRAFT_02643285 [Schizophyllum commune H4-8]|uniref:uncharacterized protein n=1 Tax=Schizophyllum commune (strain H4-8 / FGSC 9210) TaxID=578458 RepID=UPI00215F6B59|nr:uncharacterized protein SCHCODRAFT_02643285 [Schizophyllum commune H4-8]KAI5886119.1 hypothetical protein SCHCODRAFT_02643285 [Schizophyllum commune H4-8]
MPGATPGAWRWRASTVPLALALPQFPLTRMLMRRTQAPAGMISPCFGRRSPIAFVRQLGQKWLVPPTRMILGERGQTTSQIQAIQ